MIIEPDNSKLLSSVWKKKLSIEPDVRFYDTSSLLLLGERILNIDEVFLISSITLEELENIKSSSNKNEYTKFTARELLRNLDKSKMKCIIHQEYNEEYMKQNSLLINNDTRILSDAIVANNSKEYADRIIFVTNDLNLKYIANLFFGDEMIESVEEEKDDYSGYKELHPTEEQLTEFYQNPNSNIFDLYTNEYLILRDNENNIIDVRLWTGEEHRYLKYCDFTSSWFGKVSPMNNDIYQKILFDSLLNNKITMVRGKAGVGKTHIGLGYLMYKLEHNEIDRIIVFCNTVATINSAKLGLGKAQVKFRELLETPKSFFSYNISMK